MSTAPGEIADVVPLGRSFVRWVAGEVKAHMARRDVRAVELARRLGVSNQWVSVRLRAEVPMTTENLAQIARALGMQPLELLTGQSTPPPPSGGPAAVDTVTRRYSTLNTDGVIVGPWSGAVAA